MSATKIGINMRGSAGYVTDGPDQTYCLNDAYPVTRGGWTFGWETAMSHALDRDSSVDPRLAGINANAPDTPARTFRVDLPAAGDYGVRLAIGDAAGSPWPTEWQVKDGTTVVIGPHTPSATARFVDAVNANYSNAAWPGSNTQVVETFATTICRLDFPSPGGNWVMVGHIEVEQQGGGGGDAKPWLYRSHTHTLGAGFGSAM